MLHHQTPSPSNPIVRLFPRLAPAVIATKVRIERKRPRDSVVTNSNANPYQDERTHVRKGQHILKVMTDLNAKATQVALRLVVVGLLVFWCFAIPRWDVHASCQFARGAGALTCSNQFFHSSAECSLRLAM